MAILIVFQYLSANMVLFHQQKNGNVMLIVWSTDAQIIEFMNFLYKTTHNIYGENWFVKYASF